MNNIEKAKKEYKERHDMYIGKTGQNSAGFELDMLIDDVIKQTEERVRGEIVQSLQKLEKMDW